MNCPSPICNVEMVLETFRCTIKLKVYFTIIQSGVCRCFLSLWKHGEYLLIFENSPPMREGSFLVWNRPLP